MSQQLLLEFRRDAEPSMDQFVVGRNAELFQTMMSAVGGTSGLCQVHVWGQSGSGRTHILRACASAGQGRYLPCGQRLASEDFTWDRRVALWAIDDVHLATETEQAALFTLINEVRESQTGTLVTASDSAPLHLEGLRDDLRTRLGWGLVFRLHALDDAEKDAALTQHAAQLGASLSGEVRHYLLTHFTRDMSSLLGLLGALDRFALERHRLITVPLIREWMASRTQAPR